MYYGLVAKSVYIGTNNIIDDVIPFKTRPKAVTDLTS